MLIFSSTIQSTFDGLGRSPRIEEVSSNQLEDADRKQEEVWTSPNLQLPYHWEEEELVSEQIPSEDWQHTSTEDWEQQDAIEVAVEVNNAADDGKRDVEMGIPLGDRHETEEKGKVPKHLDLSVKTCGQIFGFFFLWTFLVLVLWTMMP